MESWIPQSSREIWRERALVGKRDALANTKLALYRAFGFDVPISILQEEAEKELTWNPRSSLSGESSARKYYTDPIEEIAAAKTSFEKRLRSQRAVLKRYPDKAAEYAESLLETLEYVSEERLLPFYIYAFPEERVSQHQRRFIAMREELINGTFPYQDELRGLRLIAVVDGLSDMVLFVLADTTRLSALLSEGDHWILSTLKDVPEGAPCDGAAAGSHIQKRFRDNVLFMTVPHMWRQAVADLDADANKSSAKLLDFIATFSPRAGVEFKEEDLAKLSRTADPRAFVMQLMLMVDGENHLDGLHQVGEWFMPWALDELKRRVEAGSHLEVPQDMSETAFFQARLKNRNVRYLFDMDKCWVSRDCINDNPMYSLRVKDYRKDNSDRGCDVTTMVSHLEQALYGFDGAPDESCTCSKSEADTVSLWGSAQQFLGAVVEQQGLNKVQAKGVSCA